MEQLMVFLQNNWQWLFAIACIVIYFYSKNKEQSKEPSSKIEEIGKKAEEILVTKSEEFLEKIENQVLDSLSENIDSIESEIKQPEEKVSIVSSEEQNKSKDPSAISPANGYPDPKYAAAARLCPCGSGKRYRLCHSSQWKPE